MFVLWLLVGLVLLVVGADLLVRGAGQIALAMRIPALVVGLTIVAMGTSMPELLVSVTAAMSASSEIAIANVNGSNVANIMLVLGLAALVRPLAVERTLMRREMPVAVLLQLVLPLMCLDHAIGRIDGVILIGFGIAYNGWLMLEALRGRTPVMDDELEDLDGSGPLWKHLLYIVIGLGTLVGGANLFVSGAVDVATTLGVSERFIGLTVVALGTSAPELATGLVSAWKGDVDLAVGNSIGSNLFNVTMVLGITAVIAPIGLTDDGVWLDLGMCLVASLVLVPFVLKGSMGRIEGGVLTLGYLAYVYAGYAVGDASVP